MRITLLGTGSPIPHPARAGASTLITAAGLTLLADTGRGVLLRLTAAGVLPPMLDAVFLTHLHSDHINDLNDVVTTRWIMSPGPNPLRLYGPPGTQEVVDGMMQMLAPDVRYRMDHHADLTYRPEVHVTELQPGQVFTVGSATVRVAATDHRPVEPTIAFRVEVGDTSVVLGGDGVPCAGLDELCAGATAYVQTVLRPEMVQAVPSQRFQDVLDYHSSVEDAARTAARGGVGTLVLTHYIPGMAPGTEDEWRAVAAAHFGGPIVLGDDLTAVEI